MTNFNRIYNDVIRGEIDAAPSEAARANLRKLLRPEGPAVPRDGLHHEDDTYQLDKNLFDPFGRDWEN